MLTEAEQKWLKGRKPPTQKPWATTADDNFCRTCKKYNIDCVPWFRNTVDCPTDQGGHFRDAAEFEARVAAKLAEDVESYFELINGVRTPISWDENVFLRLKHARLAVEKEMEAESAGR